MSKNYVKNRKKSHKKLVARRKARKKAKIQQDAEAYREQVLKEYNAGSEVFPMPSLIDALAEQKILQNDSFLKTQAKILDWFSSEIKNKSKQTGALDYLPDKVITFLIPLDYYLPLPDNYFSGSICAPENKILEAACVVNITRIVRVAHSAIKITYLAVSLCSNAVATDINLKTSAALTRNYERAILAANSVIGSFQAIPSRHNHHLHQVTLFSCPSKLDFFIFNRNTKQIVRKSSEVIRDNLFSDALQSRPLKPTELEFYQNCHVRERFSDDKIFELISIINKATNARCFGHDDDSILYADKFANFSLGYLYCEVRVMKGEDRKEVYDDYKKKDEKDILKEFWRILEYQNLEEFKLAIDYDSWYSNCHLKRNNLNHRFLAGGFSGKESGDALYYAAEIVRKVCEIIIQKEGKKHAGFIEKIELLRSATFFPKNMHELGEQQREKLLTK